MIVFVLPIFLENCAPFGSAAPDFRKHTWINIPWNRQYLAEIDS